jgi:hypothetical protein
MAEERSPLQRFQEQHNFEITLAFQALQERWRGIFDQEAARWSQAGKEWKLAKEQDGHLSWKPYAKPLTEAAEDYRVALAEMQAKISMLTHSNTHRHLSPEERADRVADYLEEAQRQGLVVTGTPVTPAEEHTVSRVEPHRTTEDLGFVLGAPERHELTQSEAAAIEARTDVLRERDALVEERVGPLVSHQEGEQWLQALRERVEAVMHTAEPQPLKQQQRMGH